MSPDDLDKARQRLIASSSYKQMVDRVDGNSPFADLEGGSSRGITEEEEEAQPSSVFRQVARAAVDVAVALVPVVLVVTFAKFPPPVVEALGSAATAVKASPLEPVSGGGEKTTEDTHRHSEEEVQSRRCQFDVYMKPRAVYTPVESSQTFPPPCFVSPPFRLLE